MRWFRPTQGPRRPQRASARPLLYPWLAIVVGFLLISAGVYFADLHSRVSHSSVRDPIHRFIVLNKAMETFTRLELTNRSRLVDGKPAVLGTTTTAVPHHGRWIVERGLGESGVIGLTIDELGVRYEFHSVAYPRNDLGDVHIIKVMPGPRIRLKYADVSYDL